MLHRHTQPGEVWGALWSQQGVSTWTRCGSNSMEKLPGAQLSRSLGRRSLAYPGCYKQEGSHALCRHHTGSKRSFVPALNIGRVNVTRRWLLFCPSRLQQTVPSGLWEPECLCCYHTLRKGSVSSDSSPFHIPCFLATLNSLPPKILHFNRN